MISLSVFLRVDVINRVFFPLSCLDDMKYVECDLDGVSSNLSITDW